MKRIGDGGAVGQGERGAQLSADDGDQERRRRDASAVQLRDPNKRAMVPGAFGADHDRQLGRAGVRSTEVAPAGCASPTSQLLGVSSSELDS